MTTATSSEAASISTMLPAIIVWGIGNSMVTPGLSAFAADIAKKSATMDNTTESLLHIFSQTQESNKEATTFAKAFPRRTIRQYHEHYKNGGSVSEVMTRTIDIVNKWEKEHKLIIFSAMIPKEILQAAKESDARYKAGKPLSVLDGVPVGVKDMIYIKNQQRVMISLVLYLLVISSLALVFFIGFLSNSHFMISQ